jgi:hypothetical protein
MAGPTVTYTFANATTADATQVNQNFTDLINGMTDGSKDLNINALTCAGAAVFNGAVTLGNASSDDLTITASLASTLAVKTDNSFDLGAAATALKDIYCYKVYTDALDDRGSSGITCTPVLILSAGLQVNGGTAGAKKIVYASTSIDINNGILIVSDAGSISAGAASSAADFVAFYTTQSNTATGGNFVWWKLTNSSTADGTGARIRCAAGNGACVVDLRASYDTTAADSYSAIEWLHGSGGRFYFVSDNYGGSVGSITGGGQWVLGNTSVSAPHYLQVNGNGNYIVQMDNNGNSTPNGILIQFLSASPDNNTQRFLSCSDNTTGRCIIYSDGDIVNHDNSYGAISDIRLKQDVVDATPQLDDVLALRWRKYRFKSDAFINPSCALHMGLIAQEVLEVSPGLVTYNTEEDTYQVQYSLVALKVAKALQEEHAIVQSIEKRLRTIEEAYKE